MTLRCSMLHSQLCCSGNRQEKLHLTVLEGIVGLLPCRRPSLLLLLLLSLLIGGGLNYSRSALSTCIGREGERETRLVVHVVEPYGSMQQHTPLRMHTSVLGRPTTGEAQTFTATAHAGDVLVGSLHSQTRRLHHPMAPRTMEYSQLVHADDVGRVAVARFRCLVYLWRAIIIAIAGIVCCLSRLTCWWLLLIACRNLFVFCLTGA